jgi:hypothetical protein
VPLSPGQVEVPGVTSFSGSWCSVSMILAGATEAMLSATWSIWAFTASLPPAASAHCSAGFQLLNRIVPGRVAKYFSSAVSGGALPGGW